MSQGQEDDHRRQARREGASRAKRRRHEGRLLGDAEHGHAPGPGRPPAPAGWIAPSPVWSDLPAESLGEAERALVYVAGIGAALLVAAHRSLVPLLAGVLAA